MDFIEYKKVAAEQLASILELDNSPFLKSFESGFKRGIEFYSAKALVNSMAVSIRSFHSIFGRMPDLVNPMTFNEKINWTKYFQAIPIPPPADKLSVEKYIPESLHGKIKVPEKIWVSELPELPRNDQIAAGEYFLKVNHGSAMYQKITYPLFEGQKRDLESKMAKWKKFDYGRKSGEWFYLVFDRKFFLEKVIPSQTGEVPDWKFYVFKGIVRMIQHDINRSVGHQSALYDPDFNYLNEEVQVPLAPRADKPKNLEKMIELSAKIGEQFPFARIDLYDSDDGNIYLGEITLTPGNGMIAYKSKEFDLNLGRYWDLEWVPKPELLTSAVANK
jgi:hypothetical protein